MQIGIWPHGKLTEHTRWLCSTPTVSIPMSDYILQPAPGSANAFTATF